MPKFHDVGGQLKPGPIDRTEHVLSDWEVLADAISQALGAKKVKRTDETRRIREEMDPEVYRSISYYERWIVGTEAILAEKKILTSEEVDRKVAELEERWGEP